MQLLITQTTLFTPKIKIHFFYVFLGSKYFFQEINTSARDEIDSSSMLGE